MKKRWFTGMWVFLAIGGSTLLAQGQQRSGGTMPSIQPGPASRSNFPPMGGIGPMGPGGSADPMDSPDSMNRRISEQQSRSRNNERQKRLESDTDKLVGLVTNLKERVQNEQPLSPEDVSKRAEEIEKLAKSVKEKMKG